MPHGRYILIYFFREKKRTACRAIRSLGKNSVDRASETRVSRLILAGRRWTTVGGGDYLHREISLHKKYTRRRTHGSAGVDKTLNSAEFDYTKYNDYVTQRRNNFTSVICAVGDRVKVPRRRGKIVFRHTSRGASSLISMALIADINHTLILPSGTLESPPTGAR